MPTSPPKYLNEITGFIPPEHIIPFFAGNDKTNPRKIPENNYFIYPECKCTVKFNPHSPIHNNNSGFTANFKHNGKIKSIGSKLRSRRLSSVKGANTAELFPIKRIKNDVPVKLAVKISKRSDGKSFKPHPNLHKCTSGFCEPLSALPTCYSHMSPDPI